ncbi:Ras guanine nucleotide exchange factor bud5 [Ciborinia camelliae]|nr:Ras guanine nucleotide exchange factor bud5 [Ciborinia camelliae]
MVNSKESELLKRTSAQVAPLTIQKGRPRGNSTSSSSKHKRNTSSRSSNQTTSTGGQSQITPPATPNGSQEDLNRMEPLSPVFHSFLRAFYPFNPPYAISDSTVTLPLNEGDVVLVHSIHTNGWADGTLLISGARGWLPTNYCEAYDPDAMRNLLKALLNFWDLLRSGLTTDSEIFGNQQFMRGIIAGVRYLLEKSNCLTRESPIVQSNDNLRKNRKALLSDLSALVKTAKQLQDFAISSPAETDAESVNDIIDEMILKAFKIVVRGIKFLDNLDEDAKLRQPLHKFMATVAEESYVPPTPPADSTSFSGTPHTDPAYDTASHRDSIRSSASGASSSLRSEDQTKRQSYKRISTAHPVVTSRPLSIPSAQSKRASVSHRVSLMASVPAERRQNLVSERLNSSHDTFLSYLGSFIGRLHLQSQSSQDLLATVRQSVTAGQGLLIVVEAVCAHDSQSADSLNNARNAMYDKISKLALAARDIVSSSGVDEDDVVMAQQNGGLLMAATGCVKAAGEVVAKTKFVIERIGDFESEEGEEGEGLGINVASIGAVPEQTTQEDEEVDATLEQSASRPPPPPLVIPSLYEKPLPEVPQDSPPATETSPMSNRLSNNSMLPPLPKMGAPLMSQEDYSPSDRASTSDGEFASYRSGSIAVSSTGTSSSYMRDSEMSMISQTSTRATTPDLPSHKPRNQPSISSISMSESQSTFADDPYDLESKMLEKTFAHELLHNKEGQITGGSLAALVERLTTHDSTPDSMFVSTFYLTFRLFSSPVELAQALVDRFEYVGESPHIAGPVRLRVYNVFKGWLESHWRNVTDYSALSIIEPFADEKLKAALPAAGNRLHELAQKVSSTDGPLVPRLVSSIGKTSTSLGQYVPADVPVPAMVVTKGQVAVLKNWKMGGSNPSILEFDALELARQLTIKEMNIFCSITPDELLGAAWTKARKGGSTAVNVRAMSTLSTDLSNLVADTILQYDDVKKRANIIKHWIKIADECLKLNNYDSLMAIICSLNSSTIVRLKKTWDFVAHKRKELLKALQTIVEPEKNYAVLRRRLHDHVPPCLPFVGTYLTDLTFVDAGNPSTKQLADGTSVINFDKHTRTAKIIGELQRFQIPYRLAEVPELQEWLQAQIVRVKSASDNENVQQYYRKSLLLEPRDVLITKPSPVDSAVPLSTSQGKDKFDLFGWTYYSSSSRDKTQTQTPV